MNIRTDILLRVYIAFGLIVLFALAVLIKLLNVQFVQGPRWKAMADSLSTKYVNIEAVRGNIYSVDGSLLATSVPEYELRMDLLAGGIEKDDVFYEKVDSLAAKMSAYFGDKSTAQYSRMLRKARKDHERYFLIRRKVSHSELAVIKKFPIFNLGRYKGGLITVQLNKRILPFKTLASRTIGYKNPNVQPVGLEGAYSNYIDGETGKQLMQRIAGGAWMPVNRDAEIAPKDGADIISTIDINMQDLAQNALRKQLIKSDADHGCVVLMEVATGEIRAIANFTKVGEGQYEEKFNYAIAESAEPGSTFKLASYLTMLDQHKLDTATKVDCEGGTFRVYNHTIRDSHLGNQIISVKRAFEVSSNVAVAKLVYQHYKDNPQEFTDKLYDLHLNEKLGLQIPGEGRPLIKNPKISKSWSGLTLPQMAYGYESKITPLQMLTLYNAVANNGKMISPVFVREIRRLGNTIETFKARVINEKICSDETLGKLKGMLEGVVLEGSGKEVIKNPLYSVAGKTGTAQVADGRAGYRVRRYQASFCGYFPANNPKYSMIVVINNPKGAYYGALVSGPVFREVADKVYANDIEMYDNVSKEQFVGNTKMPVSKSGNKQATQYVYKSFGIKALLASNSEYIHAIDTNNGISFQDIDYKEGMVPDVTGMGLKDALYLLGNAGLRPVVKGSGKVVKQSVEPGAKAAKGAIVMLELQ
ncbi:transpeptidase family protein [Pedobacter sp. BS3]|uniref:penicillin-binding protein n=1 Tax=Pedobacter sp. BS3 TaxID=2567937 RepID=UPI0011ED16AC|nr:penicillin-binding protein [Pedobacter sp. BS3]TZF81313.1 transpeptidase family protein [Pedobacter sp. BS3]